MVCDSSTTADTLSLSYVCHRRAAMIYNKTTLWWRISFALVFVAFAGVYELASLRVWSRLTILFLPVIWIALTIVNKVNAAAEQAATAISALISIFTTVLIGKRMW